MNVHMSVLLLLLFLTLNQVTTFEISKKEGDSSDSFKARAAFQRLRRYVGPEYMLDGKPLTGEDVSNWLSTSNVHHTSSDSDRDTVWILNKHFLNDGSAVKPSDVSNNRQLDLITLVPTKEELSGIFDASEKDVGPIYKKSVETKHDKWLKEQTSNADGFKITEQNAAPESETEKTAQSSMTHDISLDMLTKEEFKSLMTAIEKLRKQSGKFSSEPSEKQEIKKTVIETSNRAQYTHNLFTNNLKTPIAKEAVVFLETIPYLNNESGFNKQLANRTHVLNNIDVNLINDLASDVEDNLAEDAKHDMQTTIKNAAVTPNDRIIIDKEKGLHYGSIAALKRNSIRDVSLVQSAITELFNHGVLQQEKSDRDDLFGGSNHEASLPAEKVFVKRILELQDEVDKLKMIVQLEELENDVLTDALNEASLGQEEGTVSRIEFDSLKQAIDIEEALHDLKRPKQGKQKSDDIIKIRKPLEQKRDVDSASKVDVFSDAASVTGRQVTKDDLQRLLGQVYLLKDQEKREWEPEKISSSRITAGGCPPVPGENTVCTWTDLDSIPADVKAKSLCGWKDTCCGCQSRKATTTFHLGREKCDLISEAVTSAMCQDEGSCPLNSENVLKTKMTSRHHMSLIPSHNEEQTEPDFWTCRKGQQVGLWVCGYCRSVGR